VEKFHGTKILWLKVIPTHKATHAQDNAALDTTKCFFHKMSKVYQSMKFFSYRASQNGGSRYWRLSEDSL
jgi:hypothetical protein